MKYIELNNGVKMPAVGLGVFRITDPEQCEETVYQAIKMGYRLIDTAAAYENEEAVGRGIKRSGVPREELFITTKLWVTDASYEGAKRGFQRSLDRLGLDYVDLYIIHQPFGDYYGAWRAMTELYKEGKIRAIGVDNFRMDKLADFIYFNEVKPVVNLLEVNPLAQRKEEQKYMKENNIILEAWSPFGSGNAEILNNEILKELANKYNKSVGQVILRWLVQRDIVAIPKSTNIERLKQNIEIFDFEISREDMEKISKLDTGKGFYPPSSPKQVEGFLANTKNFKV